MILANTIALTHLILKKYMRKIYYVPHFPGEETEAQRSYFLRKNREIFYPKCWHQNPCILPSYFAPYLYLV